MDSEEIAVVKSFVTAINQADTSLLANLMADDHTFVDATGRIESGREKMLQGWNEYFRMFPDYKIEIDVIIHIILVRYIFRNT